MARGRTSAPAGVVSHRPLWQVRPEQQSFGSDPQAAKETSSQWRTSMEPWEKRSGLRTAGHAAAPNTLRGQDGHKDLDAKLHCLCLALEMKEESGARESEVLRRICKQYRWYE